jgi:hypothetical protein
MLRDACLQHVDAAFRGDDVFDDRPAILGGRNAAGDGGEDDNLVLETHGVTSTAAIHGRAAFLKPGRISSVGWTLNILGYIPKASVN